MTQMDIFYHAMNYSSKGTVDAASRGAFRRKSVEEATQLIEELAKSNYRAPFEALGSSSRFRAGGVIELNKMTAIEAKLDAIMNRINSHERRSHSVNEVGIVNGIEQNSVANRGLAHESPYQVEEVQYLNGNRSYNFKPNNNLPIHYTLAVRNHENLSYGGGNHQGQRTTHNHQQNYIPPGFQAQNQGNARADNQEQRRPPSFEEQMLNFMAENKRILNLHEQKFTELDVFQANTNASLKNLET